MRAVAVVVVGAFGSCNAGFIHGSNVCHKVRMRKINARINNGDPDASAFICGGCRSDSANAGWNYLRGLRDFLRGLAACVYHTVLAYKLNPRIMFYRVQFRVGDCRREAFEGGAVFMKQSEPVR